MPIVFYSYVREDLDPYLQDFFHDLNADIAVLTEFSAEDEKLSFRDQLNLRLMENWSSHIGLALQSTAVLVCITSVKYFRKEFCGKEYHLFDQRRRHGLPAGTPPPPVILPVVWAPVRGGLPDFMMENQLVPKGAPASYLQRGLRDLKRFERGNYRKCVSAFAQAIVEARDKYEKKLTHLPQIPDFKDVPNAFAGGEWDDDAVGPGGGWLPGPEVANFVFVAESRDDCPSPPGRYGSSSSGWRPYFPSEPETVMEHARRALGKQFRFREIRVADNLGAELARAKERGNLLVVIGELKALPLDAFRPVRDLEEQWWEGSAVLLVCHEAITRYSEQILRASFGATFPVISQMVSPNVKVPLRSPVELQTALGQALAQMRSAVTRPAIDAKEKTDEGPPGLTGSAGARP